MPELSMVSKIFDDCTVTRLKIQIAIRFLYEHAPVSSERDYIRAVLIQAMSFLTVADFKQIQKRANRKDEDKVFINGKMI